LGAGAVDVTVPVPDSMRKLGLAGTVALWHLLTAALTPGCLSSLHLVGCNHTVSLISLDLLDEHRL